MSAIPCPACGAKLDVTGLKAGSTVSCACGNKASVPRSSRKKRFLMVAGGLAVLLVPCLLFFMVSAVTGFQRYRGRAMQSMCRISLKQWHIAQMTHYSEHEAYEPAFAKVGFEIPRGNQQLFLVGVEPVDLRDTAGAPAVADAVAVGVDVATNPKLKAIALGDVPIAAITQVGVTGECPECDITAACVANLDGDDDLDVWLISTGEVIGPDEKPVPAGELLHFANDLAD
ncbi:hypothetical protein [Comamonas sp. JC664]|uniref:hypothetical protein n=1 Tax=Comamonas sp. JC664 TaxID=2801917 RepID=UPI00191EB40E|nr:hypothetical protein [Comamonas sp. JC664]MBL0695858.1 hypothetical protein [Comamonas sp. JC664]GHG63880.1 hypothetical protein GCM10012319_03850 [Comamonas sp. KCTC 72670]